MSTVGRSRPGDGSLLEPLGLELEGGSGTTLAESEGPRGLGEGAQAGGTPSAAATETPAKLFPVLA